MQLRRLEIDDCADVFELYKRVSIVPGGLARMANEVEEEYVRDFVLKTISNGVGYVLISDEAKLVAEIHAYKTGLFCFSHVLSDLTIAVDPAMQGVGVGRQIFEKFMNAVVNEREDISRVELVARESNSKAISFYETLGFKIEGRMLSRIKNSDGSLEADIPMAWIRT